VVPTSALDGAPDRIERPERTVMQRATADDLAHIQAVWPAFEQLVGVRGRKMFAKVDAPAGTYTVCTPIRDDDPPDHFGLALDTLAGGAYLRGRIVGEPPAAYDRIAPGMQALEAMADVDPTRPLVEFYRRADEIELWVPITG
jgi:hypothetical protein